MTMVNDKGYKKNPFNTQPLEIVFDEITKKATHQRCNRCGELKTLGHFNRNTRNKTGYRYTCRMCEKELSNQALERRARQFYYEKVMPEFVSGTEFTSFDIAQTFNKSIDYARRLCSTMVSMGLLHVRVQGKTNVYSTHIRCSLYHKGNIQEAIDVLTREAEGYKIQPTIDIIKKHQEELHNDRNPRLNGCGGRLSE